MAGTDPDVSGLFLSGTGAGDGFNLIENDDSLGGVFAADGSSIVGLDPLLVPLAVNGSTVAAPPGRLPPRTHALKSGSPARNSGDTTLTVDERLEPRPALGSDDIGAFEHQ